MIHSVKCSTEVQHDKEDRSSFFCHQSRVEGHSPLSPAQSQCYGVFCMLIAVGGGESVMSCAPSSDLPRHVQSACLHMADSTQDDNLLVFRSLKMVS